MDSLLALPALVARSHRGKGPVVAVAMKPPRFLQLAAKGLFPCRPLQAPDDDSPQPPTFFLLRGDVGWEQQLPFDVLLHKVGAEHVLRH